MRVSEIETSKKKFIKTDFKSVLECVFSVMYVFIDIVLDIPFKYY